MNKAMGFTRVLGICSISIFVATSALALQLKTEKEKASYAVGREIGANFKKQGWDLDVGILTDSFKNAYAGKPSEMQPDEIKRVMQNVQKVMRQKFNDRMASLSKVNIEEGKKFLEENRKKKDVKVTSSGLQYRILTPGKGKTPSASDTVETNYRGTLINGTEFDSSYRRNQTATFPVSGVIKGWTEALQLMKEGAKWEIVVPSALGYGSRGSAPAIGPNQTLVFEIELVAVK